MVQHCMLRIQPSTCNTTNPYIFVIFSEGVWTHCPIPPLDPPMIPDVCLWLGPPCRLLLIFQNQLVQKIISGIPSVSYNLNPDKAERFVGSDLVPNCLQKKSADDS